MLRACAPRASVGDMTGTSRSLHDKLRGDDRRREIFTAKTQELSARLGECRSRAGTAKTRADRRRWEVLAAGYERKLGWFQSRLDKMPGSPGNRARVTL